MTIILSPRESCSKIRLENVRLCYSEGEDICVLFENSKVRKYPKQHIWYYEFDELENVPVKTIKGE
jgi:hypothetical protein